MDKLKAITDSITFRTFTITLLALLMLIPLYMTEDIISERNHYYHQTLDNILQIEKYHHLNNNLF